MTPRLLLRRALLPSSPHLPSLVSQVLTARSLSSKAPPSSLTRIVQAIDTFHHLENHFAVPFGFVVPQSVDWPKTLHHLPLGVKVHRLMLSIARGRVKSFQKDPQDAQQLQKLQDMGFPMYQWQEYQFQQVVLPALRVYSSLYGGLFVPQKFVVPEGDEALAEGWPRASHGFKLGLAVAKLRKQMQQKSKKTAELPPIPETQVQALNEIGFVWHVRDAKWYQFFLPGLRKYRELYGNAEVPLAFMIPSREDDPRWPKELEGYMLGRHVYMVRSGKYSSQVQDSEVELQKLGFSFRVSDKVWSESIFPALEVFVSEFGHCDVWQEFVVPAKAPWPERAWGNKLGDTVKSIRRGAYDAQRWSRTNDYMVPMRL
ncbi:hypothetical protein PHYBOEH_001573 [Phytophthora boehmeriae]|uniref:Helicase-associated domain-containing protein n=1 Tax=Phytophthora boehmeriae TaxID=109152 RepID=A0A8T1WYR0_9STRA|nr:hypothetical protein PHYBOEH_001573 [Phytophthora boehmeriae]